MTTLLFMLALGMPNNECPFNAVCSHGDGHSPVTATITLTAIITSAKEITMDVKQLEVKEAYAVNLTGLTVGTPDAATVTERYLVIDDAPSADNPLMFALMDETHITVNNPRNVFVMNIPNGTDMPKGRELLAMVDAVMMVKDPMTWLASVRATKKFKKIAKR